MKRRLLFVQGGGAHVHDEWDSRLVESLRRELEPSYEIRYPRMPNEDGPSYAGEGGWQSDDWQPQRDLGRKLPAGTPIYIYHGLADDTAPPSHADHYARVIPQAHVCRLSDRDHQFNSDLREIAAAIKALATEA